MLSKNLADKRMNMEMVWMDDLVPSDHLVRKLDAAIDFDFIYPMVEDLYASNNGRPSVDPVLLMKLVFVQYTFGISSMRRTIREVETNIAYRWFLGIGFQDPVPHFSTFGKNYVRRFEGTDLFERMFYHILEEAMTAGFVDPDIAFIDSTHVKAHANKKKRLKKTVRKESVAYKAKLEEEIAMDRENEGKKPLPSSKEPETKEVKQSPTDPEAGFFIKNERERLFAYTYHAGCDRNGFILGASVKPANVHDSQVFFEVYDKIKRHVQKPHTVAVDAGYKTPTIARFLNDEAVHPVMPYKRPQTPKGYLKKHDFVYDEYFDCYICPELHLLRYRTTNRDGKREYVSDPNVCRQCPLLSICTKSENSQKLVQRHIWQEYLDEAEHLRHTNYNKAVYKRRSETIERAFGDLKEKHGLRWTRLKGVARNEAQAMLVFAAMNLKKMAKWKWKQSHPSGGRSVLIHFSIKIDKPRLQAAA